MSKTRYTTQETFDYYSLLAHCGTLNHLCPCNGRLRWNERWSEHVDEFTQASRKTFQGRYVSCTCGNKHECFQLSKTEDKFRISSHVPDFQVQITTKVRKRSSS